MFNPQPKKGMPDKKAKKPLKRTRIKYKPKGSDLPDVLEEIAANREWVCFVTDVKLWCLTATSFAHVLPKALNKYPKFRTYDRNIVLVADEIHYLLDHTPRSELKKDPRFNKLFALEADLKEEYERLYGK